MKSLTYFQSGKIIFIVFCILYTVFSETDRSLAEQITDTTTLATVPSEALPEFPKLSESVEAALKAENESIATLERQLSELKNLDKTISEEINAYKIQLSNYKNILVSPTALVEDIERTWGESQAALKSVSDRLKTLSEQREITKQLLGQTEGQFELNAKNLSEINAEVSNVSEIQTLIDRLEILMRRLSTKIGYLEELHETYTDNISKLEDIRKNFTEFSEKFDQKIQMKKKEALFQRKTSPLILPEWGKIKEELAALAEKSHQVFSGDFWQSVSHAISETGFLLPASFLVIFGIIQMLLIQARRYADHIEKQLVERPWLRLSLQIFHGSRLLFGTTLSLYIYIHVWEFHSGLPLIRTIFHILLLCLFSRWLTDFLELWNQRPRNVIPLSLTSHLRTLLLIIRCSTIPYIVGIWLLGDTSIILFIGRVCFETALLVWGILFWKAFQSTETYTSPKSSHRVLKHAILGLGDLIIGGGLILEFTGYGAFALYWFTSWGCTAVSCLWGGLFFFFLREWNRRFRAAMSVLPDEVSTPATPIHWLILQLSWLAWFAAFAIALIFSWGGKQTVIVSLFMFLNKKFMIGGMKLSVLGFVYGFMVLLCTHAISRIWQHTLIRKILEDSGLESGIKASVTAISTYLFWLAGILVALSTIGISTTSLAVAFGALGIGLGFGLQNIFNNFVSGIILLFERPIQVGDAVEIGGIWGEVRKINVRSTLVQTYENATLVIPNAEFISSQVTNWSFKDPRIRRIVSIGVAYGSDVERVRDILLEIADNTPAVLKYPYPSVLFTDFADSALIFKLRFWTDMDHCLIAETDIRFEINRRFREEGIQIPFPQRDVHLFPKE